MRVFGQPEQSKGWGNSSDPNWIKPPCANSPSSANMPIGMTLKYELQLSECLDQPCPSRTKFQPRNTVAYRFMRQAAREEDFLPVAILEGPRAEENCSRFALSFFDSPESAQIKFTKLDERVDAAAKYGNHIGKVLIAEPDGIMSQPNPTSRHMDLHPSSNAQFHNRIDHYIPVVSSRRSAGGESDVT